jgi:hypothetical protein
MNFRTIKAAAELQGFRVTQTGAGHWKFVPPQKGRMIVVTSGTPSDHRSLDNFLSRLRRSGFNDGVHAVRFG